MAPKYYRIIHERTNFKELIGTDINLGVLCWSVGHGSYVYKFDGLKGWQSCNSMN